MFLLNEETALSAIYGGWLLGGGGGGDWHGGWEIAQAALAHGSVRFVSAEELDDGDCVATAAMVGSPASKGTYITPAHCRRVYELFSQGVGEEVAAFIANEAGAYSITNGWIAAAMTGKPMLDAACNGRAHPTGIMGAMGLGTDSMCVQACAAGRDAQYFEMTARGSIDNTSRSVRQAASLAGGCVSVMRNPAPLAYVKTHAALGAVTQCVEIGEILRRCEGQAEALLEKLEAPLAVRVLAEGVSRGYHLEVRDGFDVGSVTVGEGSRAVTVDFWNEYLTAEQDGRRLATFPELIQLIDLETALPVCSAVLHDDMRVAVVAAPKERLLLGAGMRQAELFLPCEKAIHKPIISYAFPE